MVSISDLPEEVLLLILTEAASAASSNEILNYVLVSRSFARIATPLLYRHIDDKRFLKTGYTYPWWIRLIKALLLDPAKISWVQRVTTEQDSFVFEEKDPEGLETNLRHAWISSQVEIARIEQMIDETFDGSTDRDAEKRKRWREECLDRASRVHLFALLFPRMPNLRHLALLYMTMDWWRVIAESVNGLMAAKGRAGEPAPLCALETVWFGARYGDHTAEALAIVATWPGVRRISMSGLKNDRHNLEAGPEAAFLALKSRSTAFKTLRLAFSTIRAENLTLFLGSPRALETFEYGLDIPGLDLTLNSPEISRAISQQRHSLTKIKLQLGHVPTFMLDGTWLSAYNRSATEPMDFSSFERLRQLVIAPILLFGRNHHHDLELDETKAHILKAFPACLEELCIGQCYTDNENAVTLAAMKTAIQSRETRFPMLKKMKWECRQKGKIQAFKENEQALRDIAEEKGVKMTTFVDGKSWTETQRMSSTSTSVSSDAYCSMATMIDIVEID